MWLSRTGVTPFPQDTLVRFTPCPATSPTPPHRHHVCDKDAADQALSQPCHPLAPRKVAPPRDKSFCRRLPAPAREASSRKTFPHEHCRPEEGAGVTASREPFAAEVNKAFWLLFSEGLRHEVGLTTVRFPSEVFPIPLCHSSLWQKRVACLFRASVLGAEARKR